MRLAALVLLASCGRLGFDAHTSDGAPPRDTAADTRLDGTTADAPAAFYTDSFDTTNLDPLWGLDLSFGSINVDSTHVHGGTGALHAAIAAGMPATTNPRAELVRYQGLPVTGTIDVRAWFYFASPIPPIPFLQVINLADDPGNGISMGERNAVIANNDYTAVMYAESATALPLDTWVCLRFEMPSGTTGTSRVWLGPTELTDIALPKTSPQPQPTHLYLGIEWVGSVSSQNADVWIDDLAIGASPLPCP